jgi:NTE family protein
MSTSIASIRSDPRLLRYLPKIVYVLSGGAAKGFCYVGMLEALERKGITPDLIVGTSAGSLIGALYSHFGDVDELCERIEKVFESDEFSLFERKYFGGKKSVDGPPERAVQHFFTLLSDDMRKKLHFGMSLMTSAMIAEKDSVPLFDRIFEGIAFETLKFPFASVAVDLSDGVPVVFAADGGQGRERSSRTIAGPEGLMRAVMASCAIPLVFPAVRIDSHSFVDGSVMANLPVREARALLPDQELLLVGFDVLSPVSHPEEKLSSVELALRLLDLATRSKQVADRELVDVLFQPLNEDYRWSSFSEYEKFIEMGRAYMSVDRLAAFEAIYKEKCRANIRKDPNPFRRFFAALTLDRLARKT